MIWICCFVGGAFGVLVCVSWKEEEQKDVGRLLQPFYKIARWLYKRWCMRERTPIAAGVVEQDLRALHPGESLSILKTNYYVKKLALSLAVIAMGTLLGLMAVVSTWGGNVLGEDASILRGEYLEGARELAVTAEFGRHELDFMLEVKPRKLSKEEAEAMFEQLYLSLPEYIAGENESLEAVREDLILLDFYGEYPVEIQWKSASPEIISKSGRVELVEEPVWVTLTVSMRYEEFSCEKQMEVCVQPPQLTDEMKLYRELEEMLADSQEQTLDEEYWQLPRVYQGERIHWNAVEEDKGVLLWGIAIVTSVLIFIFADRDLHGQVEKRKKSLKKDYPQLVHKLVLYVGAGMTIRGAFCKVAGDYEQKIRPLKMLPAYEEMLYTCRELRAGVSEGVAYEHFGKRSGLVEYIRLSALLMQNLKRGNSTLLERLREEADRAAEERLQQSKKLGEEAGTKLLVPMVLMLAVVMVIVMIPAFSGL